MPNKINIDKINDLSPIRSIGQSDVKKSSGEKIQSNETGKTNNEDKLEFSNRGTEVGKLVEQVKNLPDVREEKVNEFREQISKGNYNPPSKDIADAILKDEKI